MSTSVEQRCLYCNEVYSAADAITCKECYEEASETKEALEREIEELKAKVAFLRFRSPLDHKHRGLPGFSDVVLIAISDYKSNPLPISAHRAVLASRSPVFKAMLESEMEESKSCPIKISYVSYDALRDFVNYLYTAEVSLNEQKAYELLVLAEKYQVKHLKAYCERFLVSKLNWDNSVSNFCFASQHSGKNLPDAALSMITDKMDELTKTKEYAQLVERDPCLVVEIFEAYLSKQVNTAASS